MALILDRDAQRMLTGLYIDNIGNDTLCFQTDSNNCPIVEEEEDEDLELLESGEDDDGKEDKDCEEEQVDVLSLLAKQLKEELKIEQSLKTYMKGGEEDADHES